MRSLLGLKLAFAVMVFGEGFFRTGDTDQAWVVAGERQAFGIPEQDLVGFAVTLFGERNIGRPVRE